ncbi:MAG: hypothetical protein WCC38_06210 [Pseudonocardiaceae bacterium]
MPISVTGAWQGTPAAFASRFGLAVLDVGRLHEVPAETFGDRLVLPVVSADSEPGPVFSDDPLKLGGVLRQARNIPDQHEIRESSCDVRQDLPAPT